MPELISVIELAKFYRHARDKQSDEDSRQAYREAIAQEIPKELRDILEPIDDWKPEFGQAYFAFWNAHKAAKPEKAVKTPTTDKPEKRRGIFRQAKRVSRSPETWRVLANYPTYEISSHGRVRAIDRAKPEDWLKPRRTWHYGMAVDSVVLKSRDGERTERFIGKLLLAAGFLKDWRDDPVKVAKYEARKAAKKAETA